MGKNRAQGTRWQSEIRERAKARGWNAWTINEGGKYDYGDVAIELPDGTHIVIECKATERLNIHGTQDNAVHKVDQAEDAGYVPHAVAMVVTAWKRMMKVRGSKRRRQAGSPIMAVHVDDFFDLLERTQGDE